MAFWFQNAPKTLFGWGSAPDPAAGAYDAPPDSLVRWGGGHPVPIPLPLTRSAPWSRCLWCLGPGISLLNSFCRRRRWFCQMHLSYICLISLFAVFQYTVIGRSKDKIFQHLPCWMSCHLCVVLRQLWNNYRDSNKFVRVITHYV